LEEIGRQLTLHTVREPHALETALRTITESNPMRSPGTDPVLHLCEQVVAGSSRTNDSSASGELPWCITWYQLMSAELTQQRGMIKCPQRTYRCSSAPPHRDPVHWHLRTLEPPLEGMRLECDLPGPYNSSDEIIAPTELSVRTKAFIPVKLRH
jgi:hypothetical protein